VEQRDAICPEFEAMEECGDAEGEKEREKQRISGKNGLSVLPCHVVDFAGEVFYFFDGVFLEHVNQGEDKSFFL
jgi:hypothetical protein